MVIAPVAYFAFNRPDHALKSLNAIRENSLSAQTEIHIFCDGPRVNESEEGLQRIAATRRVVQSQQWGRAVHFHFREKNLGLFDSITSGITQVVNEYGKVIVVEDDAVISPGFLQFVNEGLDLYENDEQVMHVSGYCPFERFPFPYTETSFFYNHTYCWGWGTWKRAWRHFDPNGYKLMKAIDWSGRRSYINLDQTFEVYWGLKYIHERKFQDWNYNWHASVALQNGLSLHPAVTLTNNIGFDGSGTHCTTDEVQKTHKMANEIRLSRIPLVENKRIRRILHKRALKIKVLFLLKHYTRFLFIRKFVAKPSPTI